MNKKEVLDALAEIRKKGAETIYIEAKQAKGGIPQKYYDTVSSFANTFGGIILFGVNQVIINSKTTFEITGIDNIADIQQKITNLCSTEFEPVVRPEILIVNVEEKDILAVKINEINQIDKPCFYKPKGMVKGSYTRVGDRDDLMTDYEIYKLKSYKENIQDDLRPVVRAKIDDLDDEKLEDYILKVKKDKPNFAKFDKEKILLLSGSL